MENNSNTNNVYIEDVRKRFKKAISHLKGEQIISTNQDVVNKMEINKTSMSLALKGDDRYLTEKFITKFANIYGFNKDWIWKGEGTMLPNEVRNTKYTLEDLKKIARGDLTVPKDVRNPITNVDPILADEAINYNEKGVPYYNVDFTNGFMGVIEFNNVKPDYYINYPPANNCDFWINATGQSMQNTINHGDIVAVKEVDLTWFPLGEIYAIVTSNGYRLIKRITKSRDPKCYRLVSENPDKDNYPDQDIPKRYITRLFKVIIATKIIN